MTNLEIYISDYLEFCKYQKNLNLKTIKAYSIDLKQFEIFMVDYSDYMDKNTLSKFVTSLHATYKPKSAKRKIACIKAFYNYLEYEDIIDVNPFSKIKVKFQEPFLLPKSIPLNVLQNLLSVVYDELKNTMDYTSRHHAILRDIAVLELLFATGIRVSELCLLKSEDVDLVDGGIKIYGKGSRERVVQIGNADVLLAIENYKAAFISTINLTGYFFVNRLGNRLSEQSVRFMINKYVKIANIQSHITPHMFRHSFATLLLEEDVDIRYIQKLLGHSSIVTTQIYTHVTSKKQRDILTAKHPRNKIDI